jgi:hypothetical protein
MVPFKVFEHIKFDEIVCDDWHLEGVDYSLTASEKGYKVCVLPCPVFHLSAGKRSKMYFKTLMKLIKKHNHEKVINTTMGLWPTRPKLTKLIMRLMKHSHKLQ